MLQTKPQDRVTSYELKKLINKCDIEKDTIELSPSSHFWNKQVIFQIIITFFLFILNVFLGKK